MKEKWQNISFFALGDRRTGPILGFFEYLSNLFEQKRRIYAPHEDHIPFGKFKQRGALLASEFTSKSVLFEVLFHMLHHSFVGCLTCAAKTENLQTCKKEKCENTEMFSHFS